jgi:putative Mn2+ efflux pump MntP
MPALGWLAGSAIEGLIRSYDHWIAFGLLAFVGVRMIDSGFRPREATPADPSRGLMLVALSVAVSIDALAVGLSLALLGTSVWYPAMWIGVVTGALSLLGLRLGMDLGAEVGQRVQIVGGLLLIGIGLEIVLGALGSAS